MRGVCEWEPFVNGRQNTIHRIGVRVLTAGSARCFLYSEKGSGVG